MHQVLREQASHQPDAVVLLSDHGPTSYRQLLESVCRGEESLALLGVRAGDRVLIALPNAPSFVSILYAVYAVGAIAVPLSPGLKLEELAVAIEDCEPTIVIVSALFNPSLTAELQVRSRCLVVGPELDALSAAVAGDPVLAATQTLNDDDVCTLLYTSATTGRAKGAMLSHGAVVAAADAYRDVLGLTARDRQIAMLPLFHSFGFSVVLNASILAGGSIVLMPRFSPAAAVDLISANGVTVVTGVTPMFAALLGEIAKREETLDFPSVRLAGGGATSIPPELASRMAATFSARVVQGWGLSETGAAGTFTREKDYLDPGEIGSPVKGLQVRVVDERGADCPPDQPGELWIRGRSVMKGYFGNEAATHAAFTDDGWLRTGDIARSRADGGFVFQDRSKEIIKRSGYNVYPAEVEAALFRHPDVALVAVLGVPDERVGEEVAAFVVRREGSPLDVEGVALWAQEQLASHKYPRIVVEVEALPLAPSGKVVKRLIDWRQLLAGNLKEITA